MYNTKTRKFTYYDDYAGSQTKPRERYRARAWFDDANNMWLYGGAVDTPNCSLSYNDLWMFNTTSKSWTFISGNKNQPYCKNCTNGSYPSIAGTGGTQYFPRARSDYGYWKDTLGNIWIYGGYAESHGWDDYGDLWKFNPITKAWTLISGNDTLNPPKTMNESVENITNQYELTVLLPTLNEQDSLDQILTEIKLTLNKTKINYCILVTDNGSIDKTLEICKMHNVILNNVEIKGYGANLINAFKKIKSEFIIFFDSDGSYDPKEIPNLFNEIKI
jgi:hypothetical protein